MALPCLSLARRLRAGETVHTAWCNLASPLSAEVTAREGFPAVTVDMQHGLWDQGGARDGIAAIRQGGSAPIVRVPLEDFATVSRALDWGAEGIIMPMINTVEDAKRFVGAAKFPPVGERSWGPHRAMMLAGISDHASYMREANENIVTLAMIETPLAIKNVDAIAAVPGIDMLFIGPSDLSITLSKGTVLDPHSKEVEAAVDIIVAAAKKNGKWAGLYCANAERANAVASRGIAFMAIGSDLGFLRAGTAVQVKALKR
ncbi:MAG: HpcH/HpaI aldolase/citrate lyase family protein [Pseudolabrys sp.]